MESRQLGERVVIGLMAAVAAGALFFGAYEFSAVADRIAAAEPSFPVRFGPVAQSGLVIGLALGAAACRFLFPDAVQTAFRPRPAGEGRRPASVPVAVPLACAAILLLSGVGAALATRALLAGQLEEAGYHRCDRPINAWGTMRKGWAQYCR